jgi:hypothetical protein
MANFKRAMKLIIAILVLLISSGCMAFEPLSQPESGGGPVPVLTMPFERGYVSRCTQGVEGEFSHFYSSTKYDLDFDTPNDRDDPIFAPVSGVAYVHSSRSSGFGLHINIDLGDGSYVVLGHLEHIFIRSGDEVATGQLLGLEGNTGHSSGDHLHIGRHFGDATQNASNGRSSPSVRYAYGTASGSEYEIRPDDVHCGLYSGVDAVSLTRTVRSHPTGTTVMTWDHPDVYVLAGGKKYPFQNESAFYQMARDFRDTLVVSESELACYETATEITTNAVRTNFVRAESGVWLLEETPWSRYRHFVPPQHIQLIQDSWGFGGIRQSTDDYLASWEFGGMAALQDGTLVKEAGRSDVYVVSGGAALPVESWEVFLAMNFDPENIVEVERGTLSSVVRGIGACPGDYCVSQSFSQGCGRTVPQLEVDFGQDPLGEPYGPEPVPQPETGEEYGPPAPVDNDGDGLTNYEEAAIGTSDNNPDSDGDGLLDWLEVQEGTDPLDPNDPPPYSPPIDTGEPADSASAVDMRDLTIRWVTPGNAIADHILLSGQFYSSTRPESWRDRASTLGGNIVEYVHPDVVPGEGLRFSVEYRIGSQVSWSCLAPYPPGTLQGTPTVLWGSEVMSVTTASDPASAGCGLYVEIP